MNTKDLIWFRTICECKSITKAAQKLFVSQQGLSKNMKALEQQLDVVLFDRTHNGIEPSRCGKILYEQSEKILKDWDDIVLEVQSAAHIERGYLRLCSAYGILRMLSPDFLFEFEKTYPGKAIDYMEYPDLHVDQEIEAGYFDVALHVEGPEPLKGFITEPLFSSNISLLTHMDHPLAKREYVTIQDLKDEPMIIESSAFYIHHFFRIECQRAGIEPNIIFNTSGFSLCHQLCRQKRGLSLVVDCISNEMVQTDLVRVPFKEPFKWRTALIYRKEFAEYEIIRQFREHTLNWLKNSQI